MIVLVLAALFILLLSAMMEINVRMIIVICILDVRLQNTIVMTITNVL
jgi:hypothetical protein